MQLAARAHVVLCKPASHALVLQVCVQTLGEILIYTTGAGRRAVARGSA
jgi:hypothetical protein